MAKIVGIRFQEAGKIYHFDGTGVARLTIGDHVVVDTSRGRELGRVVTLSDHEPAARQRDPQGDEPGHGEDTGEDSSVQDDPNLVVGERKPITRRATTLDLVQRERYRHLEKEVLKQARMRTTELGLRIKLAKAEYSFDGSRLTFYYGSEREVDLNRLKRDLSKASNGNGGPNARVEFRQVGPRDVAKLMSGSGACGLEKRCCSAFLTDFQPISIRMAKAQDLPLVPAEIAGMCGRLRCCLAYEYEFYKDARKGMPKVGKWVVSHEVSGKVVDRNILKQTVTVATERGRIELPVKEIWVGESGQPPSASGCAGGPGSKCDGACATTQE
ncbi:MAG: regulatory iron-sulfur-containing complex subunit RicT [Ardenticatenaceae bacterium]|nr:regulatory iron-sulfur-containing complex subunit RicT [Ardenticatenaceae bacterium]HBY97905.1 hypothetical protein [Chloroflexota bacterium]